MSPCLCFDDDRLQDAIKAFGAECLQDPLAELPNLAGERVAGSALVAAGEMAIDHRAAA